MALQMVLCPLISLAVKKASDALTQQICQMWGMDDNRNKLRLHLLAVQEKIADAEGRDSTAVREWLKELDAVALKAVDVLDEFQYEALRRNAISQGASPKVTQGFFSGQTPAVFRYQMSNKLTKILRKIDEIVTTMNKFHLLSKEQTYPATNIDRETHSLPGESEVFGRDAEKEHIVSQLMDPQRESDIISVLAIVGMGGMGKTTLAQQVFNDERVKKHFKLTLWVSVSTEFNVVNISKTIFKVATNGGDASSFNKEVLQQRLRKIFDKKKYLLVLDDVWNEKTEKWDELKTLLFSSAGSGSIIIVTTRNQQVASMMGTLSSHDLASLSNEDSWKLFQDRAFGGTGVQKPSEELLAIGKTIVQKCVGLPLAVKAMGGLMRTKRDVQDWRDISKSNILECLQSTMDVLPVLKLSYDYLPSHAKQCFAFCAIYPQDYEIERETLIQLWIANDFIPINGSIENLENKGRFIFNELYFRSFFQNIREKETDYGSIITCKMHDLMHDLATKIIGNKCAIIKGVNDPKIVPKDIHHLYGDEDMKFERIDNVLRQFPNIHTYIHEYEYSILKEEHSYLLKSCSLRAFKFQWYYPPKELGYMKHIRYLDLSGINCETLPETISTLYNLQTLKLSHSLIKELPKEMRYMVNLRHLFLDGCSRLERMPIGLGQLKCLQTLTKYVADSDKGGSIRELNNLNLLSGHMSLSRLESIKDIEDARTVNLAAKTNLSSLKLKWGETDNKERTENNEQAVIDALTPHNELKILELDGYSGFGFPKWMMKASIIRNIKKLKLERCINCAELPPLWQLPLLDDLYLSKMEGLRHIVGGMHNHVEGSESIITFPALMVLNLNYLSNLESWHEEGSELVAFPKLNELNISDCPKLKSMPVHVPLLENLRLRGMESLRHIIGGTHNHVEGSESIITFPALMVLKLYHLSNLESWHEEGFELVAFPKLNELDIYDCPKLKYVPVHVPLLAILRVENSSEIKLRPISKLPMLSNLKILVDTPPSGLDAFRPPKTLQEMTIRGFENVYLLEEEEEEEEKKEENQLISASNETKLLRKLWIKNSHCFFSCGLTKVVALGFWNKYFAALQYLEISDCDVLVFWPEEEFRRLECLKQLTIHECMNLTGALPTVTCARERGELELENYSMQQPTSLPRLELLEIEFCSELVEVPAVCSKSLKFLKIIGCPKLGVEGLKLANSTCNLTELERLWIEGLTKWRAWPDNLEHLPSLRYLRILHCPGIESFPEGLQLPSLQYLWIDDCPEIESFPEGLQQRLPSLQRLHIEGCPALEKRCRINGGDYWHLVSPIPDKYFRYEGEQINKWKLSGCCFHFRRDF